MLIKLGDGKVSWEERRGAVDVIGMVRRRLWWNVRARGDEVRKDDDEGGFVKRLDN